MNEEEINQEIRDSDALILNKHPVTVHLTTQEDSSVQMFPTEENVGELINDTNRFYSTREDSQNIQTLSNSKPQFFIEVDASAIASLRAGTQYTLIPVDILQSKSPSSKHLLHNSCETQEHLNTSLWDYESRNQCSSHLQSSSADVSPSNASRPILNLTTINVDDSEHQNSTKSTKLLSPTSKTPIASNCFTIIPTPHAIQDSQLCGTSVSDSCFTQHSPALLNTQNLVHGSLMGQHGPPVWSPMNQTGTSYTFSSFPACVTVTPSNSSLNSIVANPTISLNSSGEEVNNSPEYSRIPKSKEITGLETPGMQKMRLASTGQFQQIIGSLDSVPFFLPLNGRENHNEKERKRRGRIKNACQGLRSLVPGLSEKTDKATVFEFTVQYLLHLKRHVGIQYDKDFIEKYLQY
ncbi:uncharacterized protein LOC143235085 [Tachypleus tridentatus]|uniref:uncharacterized protein LOC143235085 n=1 Tax=Tachypleus tridentatus TaxID=6853 RepID=UPI003FCF8C22